MKIGWLVEPRTLGQQKMGHKFSENYTTEFLIVAYIVVLVATLDTNPHKSVCIELQRKGRKGI